MEMKYTTNDGRMEVTFDFKDTQDLFEKIANFQEVFESPESYTINGKTVPSSDVSFSVREGDDGKFFEKKYIGSDKDLWGAKKLYGVNKKGGGLFPKYSLPEESMKNMVSLGNGWFKYQKPQQ